MYILAFHKFDTFYLIIKKIKLTWKIFHFRTPKFHPEKHGLSMKIIS